MKTILGPVNVNDVHSQLNETCVERVVVVDSPEQVCALTKELASKGRRLAISGTRHAMGGQQFHTDSVLLDTRFLTALVSFDAVHGIAHFQAGATWVEVQGALALHFDNQGGGLTFRQKQTGADLLTLGGAVSANIHGRGLAMGPFVTDVESLVVVNAKGDLVSCSRTCESELFSLVCGGYGLFGVIVEVGLRLVRRTKLRRVVERIRIDGLVERFHARREQGFVYGDFQFRVDSDHPDFLREGVFSCYEPVSDDTPISASNESLSREHWHALLAMAHTDKARAFETYSHFYLRTNDQIYWSDLHQASNYPDGYHFRYDVETKAPVRGSEMITELYVPRAELEQFLNDAARALRESGANVVYGTIRLIEKDQEALFTWARESWACVIFNLHVEHSPAGIAMAASDLRLLIDLALTRNGSYYLTYHRFARRDQVEKSHPRVYEFLAAKHAYDPNTLFTSDWFESLRALMGTEKVP